MTKNYCVEDLDCAVCASKMQDAIAKIEGVEQVSVNFLTQRIALTAPEEALGGIEKQMVKVCRRIEPDCRIKL